MERGLSRSIKAGRMWENQGKNAEESGCLCSALDVQVLPFRRMYKCTALEHLWRPKETPKVSQMTKYELRDWRRLPFFLLFFRLEKKSASHWMQPSCIWKSLVSVDSLRLLGPRVCTCLQWMCLFFTVLRRWNYVLLGSCVSPFSATLRATSIRWFPETSA